MKITKLLLIGLAVIFFACSEDEDPKADRAGLIGSWTVTAVDYAGTSTTSVQGVDVKANFTGKGKEMNLTATFNDNPATFTSAGDYVIEVTTTVFV